MNDYLDKIVDENGCPKCGSPAVEPVKYTWWGGLLGPKLFHHTKCTACNFRYNSKTRKSNTTAIILYSAVFFIAAVVVFYLLRS